MCLPHAYHVVLMTYNYLLQTQEPEAAEVAVPEEEQSASVDATAEDVAVEAVETINTEEAPEQETPEIAVTESEDVEAADAAPAVNEGSQPERPKSPWTSSYSVTTQGPGTPGEEVKEFIAEPEDEPIAAPTEEASVADAPEVCCDICMLRLRALNVVLGRRGAQRRERGAC